MMKLNNKPLLSLKEIEDLIFKKVVSIPQFIYDGRKKRSRDLSIKLTINEDKLLLHNGNVIILSSIIDEFEIPTLDVNLFKNHYKIPEGLISTDKVLVREGVPELFKDEDRFIYNDIAYLNFRNALISSFLHSINNNKRFLVYKALLESLNDDDIIYKSLEPHFLNGDFNKIQIPNNYSEGLERLSSALISFMKAVGNSDFPFDKDALKLWAKKVLSSKPSHRSDFIDKLILLDKDFPLDWEGYKAFLYVFLYFAYAKEDLIADKNLIYNELINKFNFVLEDIELWDSFFRGFLSSKIINIYLIDSLRDWQFNIEIIAFCKANNISFNDYQGLCFNKISDQKLPFDFENLKELDKDVIAKELVSLATKRNIKNVNRISTVDGLWPLGDKQTDKKRVYGKKILVVFINDFKQGLDVSKLIINIPDNAKTESIIFINFIKNIEEDLFSLEFHKMESEFYNSVKSMVMQEINVLNVDIRKPNSKDLARNLKKIFEENKLSSLKDIFVYQSGAYEDITRVIISSIPITIFWDDIEKYHYLKV